jgi:hypothetical protein
MLFQHAVFCLRRDTGPEVMAQSVPLIFWHIASVLVWMVLQVKADCHVNIDQGAVRGSTMTSFHGRGFCSYRGIPYAEPPVGELRFRVSSSLLGEQQYMRGACVRACVRACEPERTKFLARIKFGLLSKFIYTYPSVEAALYETIAYKTGFYANRLD